MEEDNQMSLSDIGVLVWRQRTVFFGVWITVILLGIAAAVFLPRSHAYSQTVQIGGAPDSNGDLVLFESSGTVAAKFDNAIIPNVVSSRRLDFENRPVVRVDAPGNTPIVVLRASGELRIEDAYLGLLEAISRQLVKDHQRLLKTEGLRLEVQKIELVNERENVQAELSTIVDEIANINQTIELLNEESKSLDAMIDRFEAELQSIQRGGSSEDQKLSILLLNDRIEQAQARRVAIRERAERSLPDERNRLQLSTQKLENRLESLQAKIRQVEANIEGLRPTRAVTEPITSEKPVGLYGVKLVIVSAMLGFVFGLVAVFGVAFVQKVRREASA